MRSTEINTSESDLCFSRCPICNDQDCCWTYLARVKCENCSGEGNVVFHRAIINSDGVHERETLYSCEECRGQKECVVELMPGETLAYETYWGDCEIADSEKFVCVHGIFVSCEKRTIDIWSKTKIKEEHSALFDMFSEAMSSSFVRRSK